MVQQGSRFSCVLGVVKKVEIELSDGFSSIKQLHDDRYSVHDLNYIIQMGNPNLDQHETV
ncbi:hypothetical protein ACHAWC_008450 [Mediolabrus comicus]